MEGVGVTLPFVVRVHGDTLRTHKAEAEVLLRLGAIANAILTVGRRLPSGDTVQDSHDAFQLTIIAGAYVWVAIKELGRRHDGLWWKLAAEGEKRRSLPLPVAKLRHLLATDSVFASACANLRNKYAFHSDPKVFQSFIDECRGETVLLQLNGPLVTDMMFPASRAALMGVDMNDDFIETLTSVVHSFPYMVEAIIIGFASRVGSIGPVSE